MDAISELAELSLAVGKNSREVHSLYERVDYLFVAVMRGDPRFTKDEYAKPDFDSEAFDRDWKRAGKRVPPSVEIFG